MARSLTHCEICGASLWNRDMYLCERCERVHCGDCNEIGIQFEKVVCRQCHGRNKKRLATFAAAFVVFAIPLGLVYGTYSLVKWMGGLEAPENFNLAGAVIGFLVVFFALGLGGRK